MQDLIKFESYLKVNKLSNDERITNHYKFAIGFRQGGSHSSAPTRQSLVSRPVHQICFGFLIKSYNWTCPSSFLFILQQQNSFTKMLLSLRNKWSFEFYKQHEVTNRNDIEMAAWSIFTSENARWDPWKTMVSHRDSSLSMPFIYRSS